MHRLAAEHPYEKKKFVHWQRDGRWVIQLAWEILTCPRLALALIREPEENGLLADKTLASISFALRTKLRNVAENPSEVPIAIVIGLSGSVSSKVSKKLEELGALLHFHLPSGMVRPSLPQHVLTV